MSIPKRYSTHFLMLVMGKKSSAAFSICCKIGRAACSTVHTAVVPALLAPHSLTLLISSLVSDVVHNDVEFICSHCNFQKPNTLETQAVCVYLTNPGCIFLNRCHGNGLWLCCDAPEMKWKMLMCALLNKEKNKYRQLHRIWAWRSITPYTALVSHVLRSLVHRQVDIKHDMQTNHLIEWVT